MSGQLGRYDFRVTNLRQRSDKSNTLPLQSCESIRPHSVDAFGSQQVIDLGDSVLKPRDGRASTDAHDYRLTRERGKPGLDRSRIQSAVRRYRAAKQLRAVRHAGRATRGVSQFLELGSDTAT